MQEKKTTGALVMALVLLSGCASMSQEDRGVLAGGVIGGLVGSRFGGGAGQVAATGAGALVGAFVGSKIGGAMDELDRMKMQQALETNRTGQPTHWKNPDSGRSYTVRPDGTFYQGQRPCRKFTTTAWVDGRKQVIEGRACRHANGHWEMQ